MAIEITKELFGKCGNRLSVGDGELLYQTAMEVKPKVIVEVGAFDGCSSMLFADIVQQTGGKLISIDMRFTGLWKTNLEPYKDCVVPVRAESPWVDLSYIVIDGERVTIRGIDYLFVDANHHTRWCISDYHYWSKWLNQGARVAFHDWTGVKGVGGWIHKAVEIILEENPDGLEEIGRFEADEKGTIVFEKTTPRQPYLLQTVLELW